MKNSNEIINNENKCAEGNSSAWMSLGIAFFIFLFSQLFVFLAWKMSGQNQLLPLVTMELFILALSAAFYGIITPSTGLSKREYFAGLAMQACRSRGSNYENWEDLSRDAVEMADALLAELEKKNERD